MEPRIETPQHAVELIDELIWWSETIRHDSPEHRHECERICAIARQLSRYIRRVTRRVP